MALRNENYSLKGNIVLALQEGDKTKTEIALYVYNDKKKINSLYKAILDLIEDKVIDLSDSKYYLLNNEDMSKYLKTNNSRLRDVSNDVISEETLNKVDKIVLEQSEYSYSKNLIKKIIEKYPDNTDIDVVSMKIVLIDYINSTNLSKFKNKVSLYDLAKHIVDLNIDNNIRENDYDVVNKIANINELTLLSFASKYCAYHNNNFPIYDSVVMKYLPSYFPIYKREVNKVKNLKNYFDYANLIDKILKEKNLDHIQDIKRKFDHYIWYKNK